MQTKSWLRFTIIILVVIAALGILWREINFYALRNRTQEQAIVTVATTKAIAVANKEEVVLPGTVAGWHEATIYARTNGYVQSWAVDIGTFVKKDTVLAIITAPEVNAQLQQTEADLKTAMANNELAQSTAKRWLYLLKTNSVAKQEADEKVSDAKAKQAIVVATEANRNRLRDLVAFQKVVAPFDGVIMSRNTDIGRLINAGSGTVPLFRIVQAGRLRIYVRVPQNYAALIQPDLHANLYFSEHPNQVYKASLLNTAKAIDANTRTLLIQLVLENKNNEILPGGYVRVHLLLPASKNAVHLPVNTLLFRSDGLNVATLDSNDKVVLKSVKINRDFGNYVEIDSGIRAGETVIVNPPDSLINGQAVKVVKKDEHNQEITSI